MPISTAALAVALGTPTTLATAAGEPAADAPYAVEDGAYPYRENILGLTGADLIAGDGNITYTSCAGPYQIKVWAVKLKTGDSRICFAAANTGYLSVNIPRAYRVETTGRDIKAGISIAGTTENLSVPRDTSAGFGEADLEDPKQAVLLEMRVTGSTAAVPAPPAGDNPLAFTGKLNIGDTRSCTATLVDPRWVVAAKSCFADKPSESNTVAAGAPKQKTTLTVGRSDLTTSGGHTTGIVELVPRTDRDLVMARLDQPAYNVTPVTLSAAAPTAGEELTIAGFGRTDTEWAPTKVHSSTFTVGTVGATGFDLTAKTPADATVCKGDAGSPALRTVNGKKILVALGSRSWQNNCLDSAEVKTGAYDTRVDNITSWIQDTTGRSIVERDLNGDGRSDAAMAYFHANTSIAFYSSLAKADGGFNDFKVGYTVPVKSWDRNSMKLITGDYNGDHRTDVGMMYRNADSSITMYTGLANTAGLIQPFTASYTIPANSLDWNAIQLDSGDVNGDNRSDAVMVYYHANTSIAFYSSLAKADGGFNDFKVGYTVPVKSWDRNSMKLITGDYNGDHRTDVGMMYRNADTSVTMYTGLANTAGLIQAFTPSYTVPANNWDWNAIDLHSGDVNGDGRSDAVMAYHQASASIGFYSSLSKADGGFNDFKAGYTVPANSWDRNSMKLIAGDYNGDGRSDMGMMYRNGDSSVTMYTGLANTAGLIQAFTPSYTVPANNWDWNAVQLP